MRSKPSSKELAEQDLRAWAIQERHGMACPQSHPPLSSGHEGIRTVTLTNQRHIQVRSPASVMRTHSVFATECMSSRSQPAEWTGYIDRFVQAHIHCAGSLGAMTLLNWDIPR